MKVPRFSDLSPEDRDRLDAYLDGTITPEAFEVLQSRLLEDADLRAVLRRYLALDESLRSGAEAGLDASLEASAAPFPFPQPAARFPRSQVLALAAALVFFLGIGALILSQRNPSSSGKVAQVDETELPVATGFAVIGRLFDARWPEAEARRSEGDMLGAEVFRLASGTAEIQFLSGAAMTLEGPAEIELTSAWEATCRDGAVRMRVPPAARGFKLHAPSAEIVDLGTEFGLVVRDGKEHVEVFDGEIALTPDGSDETLLKKGDALALKSGTAPEVTPPGAMTFPDATGFGSRAAERQREDFARWQSHRETLAADPRLIAYYTFDRADDSVMIPNLALPRQADRDGAVVLAESVDGRWPGMKQALEFRRPGARVRVNLPGEFSSFTFAAWVRIDSLDRRYNALFMVDGYETGEPHWQIRDDGSLMLSVMVDDTKPNPGAPNDAGFHRVYYSPPIWDMTMGGQWLHLASVFDPEGRTVRHYANGKPVSSQVIEDRFFIDSLRIGNAEIGNWGQPFREESWFAIRNLNGRMDEIAIFDAALADEEIADLFEKSRQGSR